MGGQEALTRPRLDEVGRVVSQTSLILRVDTPLRCTWGGREKLTRMLVCPMSVQVRAHAPGRVNLIGEHTDYMGGLVLPMAVDRGTTIVFDRGEPGEPAVALTSADEPEPARVPLDVRLDAEQLGGIQPRWARLVAGAVAAVGTVRSPAGGSGTVTSTLPMGAGLSSSTSLMVATALAVGWGGEVRDLAFLLQRAEQVASGVPCGIMDQVASLAGVAGHALLLDCETVTWTPVPLPAGVEVVVVHSGQARSVADSAYAERRAQCERAEAEIGPLRRATVADLSGITDPVARRRARHVVAENERVLAFVAALRSGELSVLGELMAASHASLRDDFEVSTPALDNLVAALMATPGVLGARLTGAGFGGCAVALTEPGAVLPVEGRAHWPVQAAIGAAVETMPPPG